MRDAALARIHVGLKQHSLCRIIEPCVCPTSRRFEVLCECRERGIPTVVWFSPLLPFINDTAENVDGIVDYCTRAGVKAIICFGIGLTLREGNREYFYAALDRAAKADSRFAAPPGALSLKERYIRNFGSSYILSSPNERDLMQRLAQQCRKNGIMLGTDSVFNWMEEFPESNPDQLELF